MDKNKHKELTKMRTHTEVPNERKGKTKELNEMLLSNPPDTEPKTLIIRMLNECKVKINSVK